MRIVILLWFAEYTLGDENTHDSLWRPMVSYRGCFEEVECTYLARPHQPLWPSQVTQP